VNFFIFLSTFERKSTFLHFSQKLANFREKVTRKKENAFSEYAKTRIFFLTWQRYYKHDTLDTNILSSWLIPCGNKYKLSLNLISWQATVARNEKLLQFCQNPVVSSKKKHTKELN
jgi:hypothetical protein